MIAASQLSISNQAIDKIKAKRIASIDEKSLEAQHCRAWYPQVVANMLEGPNDWSFAIQRVQLGQLATNDREYEWAYAYQVPSNMAQAIRVIPDLEALGVALPQALPSDPYAEVWSVNGIAIETPYIISGTTLYSNAKDATLEYVINDIEGIVIGQMCAFALALELAAHLAVPVKGDSKREGELLSQAEVAWQRAIAEDRNRQPTHTGGYISDAMAVRHGSIAP